MDRQILRIGRIFRYGKPKSKKAEPCIPPFIDGVENHFWATRGSDADTHVMLESGISPIGLCRGPEGERTPAILIRSSPHKIGSPETPWQDSFDTDYGRIHYFGDNGTPGQDPAESKGNRALKKAFFIHQSPDPHTRKNAVPLIFYRGVPGIKDGKSSSDNKGFVEFNGFGIAEKIGLTTQYKKNRDSGTVDYFSNFVFDFIVFDLSPDQEDFDWRWINARRNPALTLEDTLKFAPTSWRRWISEGPKVVERCRRKVVNLSVRKRREQCSRPDRRHDEALKEIYDFYSPDRKARFEALASIIVAKSIRDAGGDYHDGWITRPAGDGGADFIGRLDAGSGFGRAKMILLGQAKCESIDSPTGGRDIARTVARLKRGWLGAYVTTGFFSESVQREIIEDGYPLLLINGSTLAEIALKIVHDDGFGSLAEFLLDVDKRYEDMVVNRRPEEILLDGWNR